MSVGPSPGNLMPSRFGGTRIAYCAQNAANPAAGNNMIDLYSRATLPKVLAVTFAGQILLSALCGRDGTPTMAPERSPLRPSYDLLLTPYERFGRDPLMVGSEDDPVLVQGPSDRRAHPRGHPHTTPRLWV
jgi:hypothetical protein